MEKNSEYYEKEYMPRMHRIGIITGILGVIVSFFPAVVLAVVYGLLPPLNALIIAFVTATSAFGILWIVAPISYFSALGPIGTYMAFLSGNISNMRVPCASTAQVAAEVEPGTEKGSIIAVIGMAISVIINISVLTIGVILGNKVLEMLPPKIKESLGYLLPALFGALLVQFGLRAKKLSVGILIFAILINIGINGGVFSWLPGSKYYLGILTSVFGAIAVTLITYRKNEEKK